MPVGRRERGNSCPLAVMLPLKGHPGSPSPAPLLNSQHSPATAAKAAETFPKQPPEGQAESPPYSDAQTGFTGTNAGWQCDWEVAGISVS